MFHLNHEHPWRSCQILLIATNASSEGHENLSICGHPADQPSFSSEAKPLRLDDAIADSAQGISFQLTSQDCGYVGAWLPKDRDEQHFYDQAA